MVRRRKGSSVYAVLGGALLLGVGAGFAARGSLGNLSRVRLRWTPLLFAGLAVGMIPFFIDTPSALRTTLQLTTNVCVLAFLCGTILANSGGVRIGFAIAAIGWGLNFVAVASNGGMPLSRWAFERSGITGAVTYGQRGFFKSVPTGPDTWFRPLSDVIPVRFVQQVVSIGDILLLIGIVVVVAAGMRAHHAAREPVPAA